MMFEYLKRLLKKWFAYLIFVPDLVGIIQSHFNYTIPVSSNILNYFALAALIYATYQVWNDIRLEKVELEEKLKNPIDYEVKAKIKKVKIDLDYIKKTIDENIEKSESLINSAIEELEKLSDDDKDIDPRMQMIKEVMQTSNSLNRGHSQSETSYKIDLGNYIEELKNYSSKKEDYIFQWKNFIENELKDIYFIDFYITNKGKYDEDIGIKIHFNNDNKHIINIDLLDNFPENFNLPSKPKKENKTDIFINSIHKELDTPIQIHELQVSSNKRYEKTEEHIFDTELIYLKASDTDRIFENNGYFIKITDKDNIDVVISSKHSTSKINKKLVFEESEEFDYFA